MTNLLKSLSVVALAIGLVAPRPAVADVLLLVDSYVARVRPTALVVMQRDRLFAGAGDTSRKVDVASVRKSLLSALYGIAVAEGRIRLDSTLGDLGIDDTPTLIEREKTATVRDLLTARSGIYLAAAHETADMARSRPPRGSHPPGTFWFYNNWDFNALGTIYRNATGQDLFRSFSDRIATPIGMEDFTPEDGRYAYAATSEHPAYPFKMSARDLARFGRLFLNGGRWGDKQIVPADWVRDSGRPYSTTDRGKRGYGYMWWTLPDAELGAGAIMASGYGGQFLVIVPAKQLVAVQTVAKGASARRPRSTEFVDLVKKIVRELP